MLSDIVNLRVDIGFRNADFGFSALFSKGELWFTNTKSEIRNPHSELLHAFASLIALIVSSSLGRNNPSGRMSACRSIPFESITKTERATLPGINDRAL